MPARRPSASCMAGRRLAYLPLHGNAGVSVPRRMHYHAPDAAGAARYEIRSRLGVVLAVAECDPPARQVVRRELDDDPVTRKHADVILAHSPAEMSKHLVAILKLNGEHRVGERIENLAFNGDRIRIDATWAGLGRSGGRDGCWAAHWSAHLRFLCQKLFLFSGEVESHVAILWPHLCAGACHIGAMSTIYNQSTRKPIRAMPLTNAAFTSRKLAVRMRT